MSLYIVMVFILRRAMMVNRGLNCVRVHLCRVTKLGRISFVQEDIRWDLVPIN